MKKLTAGIFATILGVTAMGTASAAMPEGYTSVATTNYVKEAVGAAKSEASSTYATKTDVSNTYATKDALSTAQTTLQGNIDAVSTVANAAAPQATTYTKEQVDAKVASVDGATAIAGLEGEIAAIKLEQTTQNNDITNLQNNKANAADVYTKTEADAAFATAAQGATADSTAATVATYGDIVTHNVAEFATAAQGATADSTAATVATYGDIVTHDASEFATAAQGAKADTAVQPAAINDMATKTWVGTQNYVDETELAGKGYLTDANLTDYAKTADVVTNGEFTEFETSNTAAIADAKKAGTDAATAAATADGKAVAAQTAADNAAAAAATADSKAVAADAKAVAAQTAADKAQSEVDALETVVEGKANASALANYVLWTEVDNSYDDDAAI